MAIDTDLRGVWIFHPEGRPGAPVRGGIEVVQASWGYGKPPYRFKAVHQNGSRLHLALIDRDGKYVKFGPEDDDYLAGERVERRAYTRDVRRGVYWEREEEGRNGNG